MKFNIALIQLDTQDQIDFNLQKISDLIDEAAQKGAQVIALPEVSTYIGTDRAGHVEELTEGKSFKLFSQKAKEHGLWIHGGSIYGMNPKDPSKPFNTSLIVNPQGELVASYNKIHLFDVDIKKGPVVKESDNISRGEEIVTVDTDYGKWGLAICYDMRFPELFRLLALDGAEILFIPANFTTSTGKDHWETLLRARAIENSCYVVAAAQIGIKPKFTAYGRSSVVDPWGNIIAKAPDKEGVTLAEIDLEDVEKYRNQVLSLYNRREDLYELKRK